MNKEEKQAIDNLKLNSTNNGFTLYDGTTNIFKLKDIEIVLNYIDKLQKRVEIYTKLAKANLKDSQEFQDNMCNHRCIKNNEVLELKEELERIKSIDIHQLVEDVETGQLIHKDKVREKMEEINNEKLDYSENEYYLENEIKGYAIDKLKELLGE